MNKNFDFALQQIATEFEQATSRYPVFNSPHEGIAVLEEEFEELKDEVFKNHSTRDKSKMRKEAIQVGAMALRFIIDCTGC